MIEPDPVSPEPSDARTSTVTTEGETLAMVALSEEAAKETGVRLPVHVPVLLA